MSHTTLQRVMVRMLHDPQLVAAVYRSPATALAGLDLSEVERGWLLSVDRRAWATDPLRPDRLLTGLIEEFPVSSLLLVQQRGVPGLRAFFAAPPFHRCVQERGSLADAFGAWLEQQGIGAAPLERAAARLRRPQAPPAGVGLVLAPTVGLVVLPEGMVEVYSALLQSLGQERVAAVLAARGHARLPRKGREVAMVSHAGSVEVLPDALAAVLSEAQRPQPRERLLTLIRRQGVAPNEDVEILDGLVADGLLVAL